MLDSVILCGGQTIGIIWFRHDPLYSHLNFVATWTGRVDLAMGILDAGRQVQYVDPIEVPQGVPWMPVSNEHTKHRFEAKCIRINVIEKR